MIDYSACTDALVDLNFFYAGFCPFIQSMTYWWAYLMFFGSIMMLYAYTKKPGATSAYAVLGSAVLVQWMPAYTHFALYITAVLGLASVLYLVYRGRDSNG